MNLRRPSYLSPSALALFEANPTEYFCRYLCPIKQPRPPQTSPMSVGSAFDALVKNRIAVDLWGREHTESIEFRLRDLVATQCEPHTLPASLELACILFEQYRQCGSYDNLMELVRTSAVNPRMEFTVTKEVGGVPLLGKPDLWFNTVEGTCLIADWKVSGSCSKRGVSPQQGYQIALDCHGSATNGKPHKKYVGEKFGGVEVSKIPMNETTDYWAEQLAVYAWALGLPVGSQDYVVRIEQLAVRPGFRTKCCVHQARVGREHQEQLLERYQRCWRAVEENHIWLGMTHEESILRGEGIARSLMAEPTEAVTTDDIDWGW